MPAFEPELLAVGREILVDAPAHVGAAEFGGVHHVNALEAALAQRGPQAQPLFLKLHDGFGGLAAALVARPQQQRQRVGQRPVPVEDDQSAQHHGGFGVARAPRRAPDGPAPQQLGHARE
ncbi:hypothetical protein MSS93_00270 [Deinococcus radiodurans]|nr:hypothetical protein MSS93_00270 [Deinococcus radiodurans]